MSTDAMRCSEWLESLLLSGNRVLVPEIADYEVRRELLRASKTKGIQKLDLLKYEMGYLPITTEVMLEAAELWAQARQQGQPTADDKSLDADVILAAQATTLGATNVMIATSNPKHLDRLAPARKWQEIT